MISASRHPEWLKTEGWLNPTILQWWTMAAYAPFNFNLDEVWGGLEKKSFELHLIHSRQLTSAQYYQRLTNAIHYRHYMRLISS